MLPPEIFTSIFLMAYQRSISCNNDYEYYDELNRMPPARTIAETSAYWRQIAISTPSLWTDIRINTGKPWYNNAISSLSHANGAPVHVTVFEAHVEDTDMRWSWERLRKPLAFFDACRQIQALRIYSSGYSKDTIDIVLKHWLDYCSPGVTTVLRIQRPEAVLSLDTPPPLDWDFDLESIEHAESVLASISVLQIECIFIPWEIRKYSEFKS
ncbi:hypothetical protein FRC12_014367 [Ceratobasidium sp. 428]|nr:hypothetical protein FRC12_014367 [Ceratobasidium sp. 428]